MLINYKNKWQNGQQSCPKALCAEQMTESIVKQMTEQITEQMSEQM